MTTVNPPVSLSRPAAKALRRESSVRTWALAIFAASLPGILPGQTITLFSVPTPSSGPLGIAAGSDGALWFTEQFGPKGIGRITTSGVITEFTIPTSPSVPYAITLGPDGALWFVESQANKIGRVTTGGTFAEYPIPTPNGSPREITTGPDGALWFTEFNGNKIGRITTAGVITNEYPTPTAGNTFGITAGPDGNLWFTEINGGKVGRITTAGVITEFSAGASNPTGITAGPDGALWFVEGPSGGNKIARMSTAGVITNEYSIPTPSSFPFAITVGPDGNLWFTEQGGNKVGRITTAGVITEIPVPGGYQGGYITGGPDGNVWFTDLTTGNKIGRVNLKGANYFTVSPCRVADTRNANGPYGGPALAANADRSFVIAGQCGIPSTAVAVAFNLTITQPSGLGDLRIFPGGAGLPLASTLNWRPGQTRANNAIVSLGPSGDIVAHVDQATGSVHLIIDVNGYFN